MEGIKRHRALLVRGFGIAAAAALFFVGCSDSSVDPATPGTTTATDKYVAYNFDETSLSTIDGMVTYDQLMSGSTGGDLLDGREGGGDTLRKGGDSLHRGDGKGPGGPGDPGRGPGNDPGKGPGGKDSLHREDTTHKGGPPQDSLHRGDGKDPRDTGKGPGQDPGKGPGGKDSLHREDTTHHQGGDDTTEHHGRIDDPRGGPGKGPGNGPRDTTLGLNPRSLLGIVKQLNLSADQDAAVQKCFAAYQECVMTAKHRYADARKAFQDEYKLAADRIKKGVDGGSITPEDARKMIDSLNKDLRAKVGALLPAYNAAFKSCTDELYHCIESQLTADQLGKWRVMMKR